MEGLDVAKASSQTKSKREQNFCVQKICVQVSGATSDRLRYLRYPRRVDSYGTDPIGWYLQKTWAFLEQQWKMQHYTGYLKMYRRNFCGQINESQLRLILCIEGGQMKETVTNHSMSKVCSEDCSSRTRYPTQRITIQEGQCKCYRPYQWRQSVLTCSFYSGNSNI